MDKWELFDVLIKLNHEKEDILSERVKELLTEFEKKEDDDWDGNIAEECFLEIFDPKEVRKIREANKKIDNEINFLGKLRGKCIDITTTKWGINSFGEKVIETRYTLKEGLNELSNHKTN